MGIIQSTMELSGNNPYIAASLFYLEFCVFTSLFFSLFLLGGTIVPLFALLYLYYVLYKRIKCFNNNTPGDECNI